MDIISGNIGQIDGKYALSGSVPECFSGAVITKSFDNLELEVSLA